MDKHEENKISYTQIEKLYIKNYNQLVVHFYQPPPLLTFSLDACNPAISPLTKMKRIKTVEKIYIFFLWKSYTNFITPNCIETRHKLVVYQGCLYTRIVAGCVRSPNKGLFEEYLKQKNTCQAHQGRFSKPPNFCYEMYAYAMQIAKRSLRHCSRREEWRVPDVISTLIRGIQTKQPQVKSSIIMIGLDPPHQY